MCARQSSRCKVGCKSVVGEDARNGALPRVEIVGIERWGGVADDLGKRRAVGHDDRRSARHRLERWKTKTLGIRRDKRCNRFAVNARELAGVDDRTKVNAITEATSLGRQRGKPYAKKSQLGKPWQKAMSEAENKRGVFVRAAIRHMEEARQTDSVWKRIERMSIGDDDHLSCGQAEVEERASRKLRHGHNGASPVDKRREDAPEVQAVLEFGVGRLNVDEIVNGENEWDGARKRDNVRRRIIKVSVGAPEHRWEKRLLAESVGANLGGQNFVITRWQQRAWAAGTRNRREAHVERAPLKRREELGGVS